MALRRILHLSDEDSTGLFISPSSIFLFFLFPLTSPQASPSHDQAVFGGRGVGWGGESIIP